MDTDNYVIHVELTIRKIELVNIPWCWDLGYVKVEPVWYTNMCKFSPFIAENQLSLTLLNKQIYAVTPSSNNYLNCIKLANCDPVLCTRAETVTWIRLDLHFITRPKRVGYRSAVVLTNLKDSNWLIFKLTRLWTTLKKFFGYRKLIQVMHVFSGRVLFGPVPDPLLKFISYPVPDTPALNYIIYSV